MFKNKYYPFLYIFILLLAGLCFTLPVSAEDNNENTLKEIQKRGVLHWGSDAEGGAPYSYYNPLNPSELIGFEVDIIKEITKKLDLKEKMFQNEWDALVPALKRKNFDIAICGIEVTENRKREINFSRPYYIYSQQIVVRKDQTNINKPEDLKGKLVGTLSASAALKILVEMGDVNYKIYPSVVGAYEDLANERVEAVLLDLPIAIYYAKPNAKLKFVGEPFGKGFYSIAVRKSDPELLAKMDEIIGELIESGKMFEITKRWGLWTKAQTELLTPQELRIFQANQKVEQVQIENANVAGITASKTSFFSRLGTYIPLLLKGAVVTLQITFISMAFAVILGLSLAIVRLFAPQPFSFLSALYVEVFRGTPLLIQLYIIYYGLPNVGIKLEAFTAAILGLALNYAAYEAENYRAGIRSIPRGQMEAALALGMTKSMALRKIIIPQAIKVVIPPVTNDLIAMFKDSSIVSVITMVELTKVYSYLASSTYNYMQLGLVTAGIYFMMSYPASIFARNIERRLSNEHH